MFMSKWLRMMFILVLVTLFSGIVALADVKDNLTYQGNKARITVGTIKAKAEECSSDMAASIGEMLSTALANNDKFIVLASQEEVGELADEIDLGESGYVEEGRAPEKGLMEGADILVTGAVTAFEPDAGGSGGALGGLKKKAFGKVGMTTKSAKIIIDIKLIDIRTRRVLKAVSIEAKSTSWGTDVAGGGWAEDMAMAGALGVYSNQPMEKAIRTLLVKTVNKIAEEVPAEYYRYKGQGQYTQQYGTSGQTAAAAGATAGGSPSESGQRMAGGLWLNYDFVPGDRVLFYEDYSSTPVGDFPNHLTFGEGNMEVAQLNGKKCVRSSSSEGIFDIVLPEKLPEQFTIEFTTNPSYYLHIFPVENDIEYTEKHSYIEIRDGESGIQGEGGGQAQSAPREELRGKIFPCCIMADGKYMKVYVNGTRVANVPNTDFVRTNTLRFKIAGCGGCDNGLIGPIRIAAGGRKILYDALMQNGRVATQGVYFESGSDQIKPESTPTLKEIGTMLADHPELRLSIEGHTDSDGVDEYNMTLSQNRANAVRGYLITNFNIASDRLQTQGFGETKPVSPNTTSEGKANNRRVELVKL